MGQSTTVIPTGAGGAKVQNSIPTNPQKGDFWVDTSLSTPAVKWYDGTEFIRISPTSTEPELPARIPENPVATKSKRIDFDAYESGTKMGQLNFSAVEASYIEFSHNEFRTPPSSSNNTYDVELSTSEGNLNINYTGAESDTQDIFGLITGLKTPRTCDQLTFTLTRDLNNTSATYGEIIVDFYSINANHSHQL
jgi:hypothetical protein